MPPKIHEVKQIEGKSLGIVAVNDISKGTLILKETPQMSHIVINALTPNLRPVVPGCAGCAMAHPDFGRSVNAISTRGYRLCPPNYYWHTQIFRPSDGPENLPLDPY